MNSRINFCMIGQRLYALICRPKPHVLYRWIKGYWISPSASVCNPFYDVIPIFLFVLLPLFSARFGAKEDALEMERDLQRKRAKMASRGLLWLKRAAVSNETNILGTSLIPLSFLSKMSFYSSSLAYLLVSGWDNDFPHNNNFAKCQPSRFAMYDFYSSIVFDNYFRLFHSICLVCIYRLQNSRGAQTITSSYCSFRYNQQTFFCPQPNLLAPSVYS